MHDLPSFTCYVCNTTVNVTCTHGAPLPPNPKDAEIAALKASLEEATKALEVAVPTLKRIKLVWHEDSNGCLAECTHACRALAKLAEMKLPPALS
jgi:hypothetical protein